MEPREVAEMLCKHAIVAHDIAGIRRLDGQLVATNNAVLLRWKDDAGSALDIVAEDHIKIIRRSWKAAKKCEQDWPTPVAIFTCDRCEGDGTIRLTKDCDHCAGTGECICHRCENEHDCPFCEGSGEQADATIDKRELCDSCFGSGIEWDFAQVGDISIAGRYVWLLSQLEGIRVVGISWLRYAIRFRFDGGDGLVCHCHSS